MRGYANIELFNKNNAFKSRYLKIGVLIFRKLTNINLKSVSIPAATVQFSANKQRELNKCAL